MPKNVHAQTCAQVTVAHEGRHGTFKTGERVPCPTVGELAPVLVRRRPPVLIPPVDALEERYAESELAARRRQTTICRLGFRCRPVVVIEHIDPWLHAQDGADLDQKDHVIFEQLFKWWQSVPELLSVIEEVLQFRCWSITSMDDGFEVSDAFLDLLYLTRLDF